MAPDHDETVATVDDRPASADRASERRIAARYLPRDTIGRGGMGEVVAARDEQIGRDVAIKRIRAREPSERQIERFLREARIQGRLDHPAIVPVHEVGRESDGLPFFVMKKLAGTTLAVIVHGPDREQFGRQRLLRAFVDVCLAVEFAHVRGVIHRDLKPDNIVLGDYGEVYVLDWGVAKVLGEADDVFDDLRSASGTATGAAIGTPGYMSPEQEAGVPNIDRSSDVYSLGCVLAEILKYVPGEPAIEVESACVAARITDPTQRPTARALGDMIQQYLDGDRDVARRRALAAEQLALARGALASDDSDARANAVRFGGRALALDPESGDAASLISSLIVEPPRTLPPALVATLGEEERMASISRLRGSSFAVLSMFGVTVLLPFLSVKSWSTLGMLYVVAGVCFVALWQSYRRQRPSVILNLLVGLVLSAAFTRVLGPFILTPIVIAGALLPIAATPRLNERPWLLGAWLLAVVFVPPGLEALGWFQTTTTFTHDGVISTSTIFEQGVAANNAAVWFANVVLLSAVGLYAVQVNRENREARRDVRIQAWHLAQLLPRDDPHHR